MKFDFYRHVFEKFSNIKFYKTPASWRRVVPRDETEQKKSSADMTELTVLAILRTCLKT
jgi:hypothetical protein